MLAHGENKVSFRLKSGMQVDVRILEKESFGAALLYFTGSKEHNVALRGRANKMGYTLNEYALATLKGERPVARATEEEIYAKLGLDLHSAGAARKHGRNRRRRRASPAHTSSSLRTCAATCRCTRPRATAETRSRRWRCAAQGARLRIYLADRSQQGRDRRQRPGRKAHARADHAKSTPPTPKHLGIRILASSEVDILKDGKLDLDDEVLAQLDVVLVSRSTPT